MDRPATVTLVGALILRVEDLLALQDCRMEQDTGDRSI